MASTVTHGTCEDCKRVMDPGVGCTLTHVTRTEKGKLVKRIFVGEIGDWAEEGNCHDCNAGPGKPHHPGCDNERCPECGGQMLGCLGEADEFGGCGWIYMARKS